MTALPVFIGVFITSTLSNVPSAFIVNRRVLMTVSDWTVFASRGTDANNLSTS